MKTLNLEQAAEFLHMHSVTLLNKVRVGGLHELPSSSLDVGRRESEMLLPNTLPIHLGNGQARQDQDVRRARAGETSSRTNSGTNTGRTGRTGRTGQPTGAEGSGYVHLAPPGAGVGIVRSGGSDTGGRPTAATPGERIDLPVDSSPSKSREAGQAERAAASAAEEVAEQIEPIEADTHQGEVALLAEPVKEWFSVNLAAPCATTGWTPLSGYSPARTPPAWADFHQ